MLIIMSLNIVEANPLQTPARSFYPFGFVGWLMVAKLVMLTISVNWASLSARSPPDNRLVPVRCYRSNRLDAFKRCELQEEPNPIDLTSLTKCALQAVSYSVCKQCVFDDKSAFCLFQAQSIGLNPNFGFQKVSVKKRHILNWLQFCPNDTPAIKTLSSFIAFYHFLFPRQRSSRISGLC